MDTIVLPTRAECRVATACPSCGGTTLEPLYQVQSVPLHSCILLDTADAARSFPRRDIELVLCPNCGFAFNAIFDVAAMAYAANFEESQHFSDTFNAFARDLVDDIVRICDAPGKRIVEIGCGKGEFLDRLCRAAGATGVGIDPAYRADPGRTSGVTGLQFLPERFGPAHYGLPADLVVCRHTLEHIAPVGDFVGTIRRMIGAREDVWVVFETPDFARVLEEGAFWDIYYEHCSYFSTGSLARLFRATKFDVVDLELDFNDQYIILNARPSSALTRPTLPLEMDEHRLFAAIDAFPKVVGATIEKWKRVVLGAHAAGKRPVIWGSGSKGVSFLTTMGIKDEIACVVDINPYRQGKFMPGSGHEIVAPAELKKYKPEAVIVMNPAYVREIGADLEMMGVKAEVIAV